MKSYTPQGWYDLSKELYDLIVSEIEEGSGERLKLAYPKLVVMYQFFRYVRGEAFLSVHPAGMGDLQQDMYKMENDLTARLAVLEKKLAIDDKETAFHLDTMKKLFSLKYFN